MRGCFDIYQNSLFRRTINQMEKISRRYFTRNMLGAVFSLPLVSSLCEAHGWHYDRVADEPEHLIIKPTKDKLLTSGDISTISDQRDNIHWFKAQTEPVFMFNIGVYGLDSSIITTGRDYIDPNRGENLKDGLIRVPRITAETAYKIYGKS